MYLPLPGERGQASVHVMMAVLWKVWWRTFMAVIDEFAAAVDAAKP